MLGDSRAAAAQVVEEGIEAIDDVGVAHAHPSHAERCHVVVALAILGAAPIVHGPIPLDREPEWGTVEVHDGSGDHLLAAELPAAKPPIAQRCP